MEAVTAAGRGWKGQETAPHLHEGTWHLDQADSFWEEHLPLLDDDAGWKVPALPCAVEMSAVSL